MEETKKMRETHLYIYIRCRAIDILHLKQHIHRERRRECLRCFLSCVCWRSPWYGIHLTWWTVSFSMSLSMHTASSKCLVKLVPRYGSVPTVSNIFLILGDFFPNCIAILCFLFSLFLSKLLHELRRFQTSETGHCCCITLMYHLAASSHVCLWMGGGRADPFGTIYYRMSGQAKAPPPPKKKKKKKKYERRVSLFLAHVFIFLV